MRVGVCLGDFVPEAGGGYTFTSQVFDAFLRRAHTSSHHFVAFCHPTQARSLQSSSKGDNLEFIGIPPKGFVETGIAAVKHFSPLVAFLYRVPSRFERAARSRGVELVWFVGGGVYDTPDIPYIGTVWDIQHRTHPWFPEVSSRGHWVYREVRHATFLRRATYVITGTKVGAEQLGAYYQVPQDRIRILPHPTPTLPTGNDAPSPRVVGAVGGKQFLVYPAQFWPHKNHVNLVRALHLLHTRHGMDVDLVLTGSDKGNLGRVKSVVDDLKLTARVHMLGFVTTEDLVWLYRHATALVYPSFSGPENLPPLEACSVGCPVVLAEYPGAREQLGDAAMFCDPHDPEQMAEAITHLRDHPDLRQNLMTNGYKRAASWTADDYVKGVFAMLDEFETVRRCWA